MGDIEISYVNDFIIYIFVVFFLVFFKDKIIIRKFYMFKNSRLDGDVKNVCLKFI